MSSTNLAKIRREKMLNTIIDIKKGITDEEILNNLSLIENELNKKKYGLIWEEHEERVDRELKTSIPVFEEIKNRKISSNQSNKYNFLIEGDNLHSLYLLEKTHKNKIDLIYIDPPYNTGNKDFTYGDSILDRNDGFKHSKWLSFMSRRLEYAKRLLSDIGFIFISIDDNEKSQLKMLCDDIFGEDCFKAEFIVQSNPRGSQASKFFAIEHEYLLCYSKISDPKIEFGIEKNEDNLSEYNLIDERGRYRLLGLRQRGGEWRREQRPFLYYPIYVNPNNGKVSLEKSEEFCIESLPLRPSGEESRWTWSKEKFQKEKDLLVGKKVNRTGQDNFYDIFRKDYLESSDGNTKLSKIKSIWNEKEINYQNGGTELKKYVSNSIFTYPKPLFLINKIVSSSPLYKNSIILDFFAGSGTTGQSVLEMNKLDNGHRTFILCTNDENSICQKVTYPRIKGVITGINDQGINVSEPIEANLKYYKTSYIPRINTDEENLSKNLMVNIKNLIQLENGIEIDDKIVRVILTEEEIDKFTTNEKELNECEKLYISSDILLTSKQSKIFKDYNIELFIIPEYYFEDEIREVA